MLVDRKLRYTMDDHAYLILDWLESGELNCGDCPARPVQEFFASPKVRQYFEKYIEKGNGNYFGRHPKWFNYLIEQGDNICEVCTGFVGIIEDTPCPCHYFGGLEEAIRQTWVALQDRGYI